ncbi:uncharacterized protein LOC141909778 [Tubulanus polymorphus]|uniref:uncharacterized protein LOC141909778 n=1 Tax=Tubulanus polymorphus TaxID=672921 RepID=UPI003DA31A5A
MYRGCDGAVLVLIQVVILFFCSILGFDKVSWDVYVTTGELHFHGAESPVYLMIIGTPPTRERRTEFVSLGRGFHQGTVKRANIRVKVVGEPSAVRLKLGGSDVVARDDQTTTVNGTDTTSEEWLPEKVVLNGIQGDSFVRYEFDCNNWILSGQWAEFNRSRELKTILYVPTERTTQDTVTIRRLHSGSGVAYTIVGAFILAVGSALMLLALYIFYRHRCLSNNRNTDTDMIVATTSSASVDSPPAGDATSRVADDAFHGIYYNPNYDNDQEQIKISTIGGTFY